MKPVTVIAQEHITAAIESRYQPCVVLLPRGLMQSDSFRSFVMGCVEDGTGFIYSFGILLYLVNRDLKKASGDK